MAKPRKKKVPTPVEGEVIGVSTLATVGLIIGMTVLVLVGLGLVVGWFLGASLWLLLGGLVLLLFGGAGIAMAVVRMATGERLVIGSEMFQVVHRVKGEDVVVTQIPYANVAELVIETGDQSNYIGIDLDDLTDPDTYDANDGFESTKGVRQHHYLIDGGYVEPLPTIYELLKGRLESRGS